MSKKKAAASPPILEWDQPEAFEKPKNSRPIKTSPSPSATSSSTTLPSTTSTTTTSSSSKPITNRNSGKGNANRNTDEGALQMFKSMPPLTTDVGMCLTLHQPWASLIVFGLKRSDGRTWPSEYRGRLWIHSAAHEATPDEITAIEDTLRDIRRRPFPTSYPTSALLGCVDMVDCVTPDQYEERRELPRSEEDDDLSVQRYDEPTFGKLPKATFEPAARALKPIL